jgi:hypothetical protein
MKWSLPEVMNSVQELSHFMTGATTAHMKAMYGVMKYCLGMRDKNQIANGMHDGDPNFEFVITGCLDSLIMQRMSQDEASVDILHSYVEHLSQ